MTAKFRILVLNGPNLNLLGKREPGIYGAATLDDIVSHLQQLAAELDVELTHKQSNAEYELVDTIHQAMGTVDFILINPAAFTHTSVAILDALHTFEGPVLEVHISNVHKRESFRHHSYVSLRAEGVIAGFGVEGYALAMRRMGSLLG